MAENVLMDPFDTILDQGLKILIYGDTGNGKTRTSITCPGKVLILNAEAGVLSIKDWKNDPTTNAEDVKVLNVQSIQDVEDARKKLEAGELEFDTVVLDSVSEIAEIMLAEEKRRNKDARAAYGNVNESMTKLLRAYRDLKMHVLFLCKLKKSNNDGVWMFEPALVGQQLGQQIPYFFDEVFAIRKVEETNEDGQTESNSWLQTNPGQNYVAKDRSNALDDFEVPNITNIIDKIQNQDKTQEIGGADE